MPGMTVAPVDEIGVNEIGVNEIGRIKHRS
jgi:hypothetical protein